MAKSADIRRNGAAEARLAELLDALHDRDLSDHEAQELRALLEQSEGSCRAYLKTVHLVAGLKKWANSRGDGDLGGLLDLSEGSAPDAVVAAGGEIADRDHTRRRSIRRFALSAVGSAIAASVLCVAWLGGYSGVDFLANLGVSGSSDASEDEASTPGPSVFVEDTQQIVARVVSVSSDLRWAGDAAPPDFLMRLRPGDLVAIESGVAQVEFTSGAELILDSACRLQITSPTSARLLQGMLVGRAEGDDSFTLVTPSATVVDVGTEFGVRVDGSGTDVSVFDGEVHVHGLRATEPENGFVRKLLEGMSVRVDGQGVHRNATAAAVARLYEGRESLRLAEPSLKPITVSLLDLFAGKRYQDPVVAGSIDPVTGFWGRYEGFSSNGESHGAAIASGETSYKATRWTPLIDGVFVPKAGGTETQYNSKGATIDLPTNSGESWGPVWARRRLELEARHNVSLESDTERSEISAFVRATARLAGTNVGLLGLHANVGVTFDLDAIRERAISESNQMRLVGSIASVDTSRSLGPLRVDARVYVDGRQRYSRIGFEPGDGEEAFRVPLSVTDRFLTIVATDSDGSFQHDLVVLIDPRIEPVGSPLD